jgi:hypothetical protein
MSEKKTIQFNESLFNGGNNKTKKNTGKKQKKEKPKTLIKPNKLKKDLLEKIKKHQQQQKITKEKVIENPVEEKEKSDFHNDFINSLEYLNKVTNKNKTEKQKKHKKHKAKSLKHRSVGGGNNSLHSEIQPIQNDPFVSIDLPTDFETPSSSPIIYLSELSTSSPDKTPPISNTNPIPIKMEKQENVVKEDPGWGILKGGKKPTYRTFHNKTLKVSPKTQLESPRSSREHKLEELKKKHKKIRQKSRKTVKSKYNLGRSMKKGKMSILIKNNTTRRKIKKEHGLLKQKPLGEVKKYLYERNLLKIGSTAPNDVIRTLYEQAVLAGEINNFSNDISLHNFISKE